MIPLGAYCALGYALIALAIVVLVTAPLGMKVIGFILAPVGVAVIVIAKLSHRPFLRRDRTRQT